MNERELSHFVVARLIAHYCYQLECAINRATTKCGEELVMTVVERSQDIPPRETPATAPLRQVSDQAHPDVASSTFPEPHLEVEQIQGNILPGFLKDHEMLLFLKIEQVAICTT